ncbi:MAG: hypothetical protein L3J21_08445 [Devosiaceae bacterium]|nr:hypothetical protein [Devosiaceae bacterium]
MHKIDWVSPLPRKGFMGSWDRFVGPGATDAEEWLQLLGGLLIALAVIALYWLEEGFSNNWLTSIFVVILALDLGGGLLTNATNTAKRWYHRPQHSKIALFRFIAIHGLHIGIFGWLFASNPITYFALVFGFLMIAAVVILWVPLYLQRPTAVLFFSLGLLGAQLQFFGVAGLNWFLPLLFFKLLIAHLVTEAPFSPEKSDASK